MLSLQSLLSSIFAEKGIYRDGNYRDGNYISLIEIKGGIPIEIMFVAFGIFMIINDIRGKNFNSKN